MPIPSTSKWPKPKSEDEFEDIVLDFLKLRWGDPNATRNGRRGQHQNGVDIYGVRDGKTVAAQCKNTEKPTLKLVIEEVEKAKTFKPGIEEFLFVVAADRDAALQEEARVHFDERSAAFRVDIGFWDDIVHEVSGAPLLVDKWWPSPHGRAERGAFDEQRQSESREPNGPPSSRTAGKQRLLILLKYPLSRSGTVEERARTISEALYAELRAAGYAPELLPGNTDPPTELRFRNVGDGHFAELRGIIAAHVVGGPSYTSDWIETEWMGWNVIVQIGTDLFRTCL